MADSKTRQRSRSNTDGIVLNHLQPQALELEEAVIGALMIEQDAFPKVSDIVKKESFYDHRHQVIYEAVANLSLNQRPIDILTVTEQLKSNGIHGSFMPFSRDDDGITNGRKLKGTQNSLRPIQHDFTR